MYANFLFFCFEQEKRQTFVFLFSGVLLKHTVKPKKKKLSPRTAPQEKNGSETHCVSKKKQREFLVQEEVLFASCPKNRSVVSFAEEPLEEGPACCSGVSFAEEGRRYLSFCCSLLEVPQEPLLSLEQPLVLFFFKPAASSCSGVRFSRCVSEEPLKPLFLFLLFLVLLVLLRQKQKQTQSVCLKNGSFETQSRKKRITTFVFLFSGVLPAKKNSPTRMVQKSRLSLLLLPVCFRRIYLKKKNRRCCSSCFSRRRTPKEEPLLSVVSRMVRSKVCLFVSRMVRSRRESGSSFGVLLLLLRRRTRRTTERFLGREANSTSS